MDDPKDRRIIELLEQLLATTKATGERIHNIENGVGVLNQAMRNLVLTDEAILAILRETRSVTDFTLRQLKGDSPMPIVGIVLGATGTFQIGFVPATNFIPLQSGPTAAIDDPNAVLTQPDANNQITITPPAGDTAAGCNVTISGVNDKGDAVQHTFNIPYLPAPPPPPQSISDFSLDQLS